MKVTEKIGSKDPTREIFDTKKVVAVVEHDQKNNQNLQPTVWVLKDVEIKITRRL